MDTLLHDVRYAFRALLRSPGFTFATVLTLALGIGANTAMFSVIRAVLLRPLPFPEPDRLVRAFTRYDAGRSTVSPPDFVDWRSQNRVFTEAAAWYGTSYTLTAGQSAERIAGATTTAGFFSVLGRSPALGRGFSADDEVPGQHRVVVLSDGLWRDLFGGDPAVIGRPIMLDGVAYTVIGVMPPGFAYPANARLWTALAFTPNDLATQRGAHYLSVAARLRPGVPVDVADRDLAAIATRLARQYPDANPGSSATVIGMRDVMVGPVQLALYLLLGAVGLVLAIACTNVANLLLARALARDGELAVRAALGASRIRLTRALVTESLVLGALGGAAGILLAWWGTGLLARLQPANLPRVGETSVDLTVLAFAVALAVATGLLFGIVPAVQASRAGDLSQRLKAAGRSRTGRREARRTRQVLVVAQVGLAVVLLVGAGVLLRSFVKLRTVDPGFRPDGVFTFSVSLPDAAYPTPDHADRFYTTLLERLAGSSGRDAAVGAVSVLPLSGSNYSISVNHVDGVPFTAATAPSVQVRVVTPGYFAALEIPVERGRGFTDADRRGQPPVTLVSASAARLLWPGVDPIGQRFELGTRLGLGGERVGGEVVGTVGDVRDDGLATPPRPTIYVAHHQFPLTDVSVVVRSTLAPAALTAAARATLVSLDARIPLYAIRTMPELVHRDVAQPRLYLALLGAFAFTAVALAAIGVYAVIAYGVRQRTHEIGVRFAMGAARKHVVGLVVGGGMRLAAMGIVLGLVAAAASGRVLGWLLAERFPDTRLLYETAPTDALSIAGAAVLFALVAAAASYVPARRAAGVQPVVALRDE